MFGSPRVRAHALAIILIGVPAVWGTPVLIDPDAGWSGYFVWKEGVGPIAGISTTEFNYYHQDSWVLGDTEWSITLSSAGVLPLIRTADGYDPPGDELALRVDGVVLPWTISYDDAGGYFHAEYHNLALSAGAHILTFDVTALCGPRILMGSGPAHFSPVVPLAVPVPAAVMLAGLGVGWVAGLRRRRVL
jgi:hypothetical protein